MNGPAKTKQWIGGVNAAWEGLGLALSSARVRRSYVRLTIAIGLIALIIDAIGIAALWHWTDLLMVEIESVSNDTPDWLQTLLSSLAMGTIGVWVLRAIGLVVLFFLAPILAFFVVNFVFPFFNDAVFLAGMEIVAPARGLELAKQPGRGTIAGIVSSLRRISIFLMWSLLAFALGFLPGVGLPIAAALQFWCTARATVWELLDPYFDRSRLSFSEQRYFLRSRFHISFVFASPLVVLLAIPIIGPFFFGLAQAATAKLVWEMEQMFDDNFTGRS